MMKRSEIEDVIYIYDKIEERLKHLDPLLDKMHNNMQPLFKVDSYFPEESFPSCGKLVSRFSPMAEITKQSILTYLEMHFVQEYKSYQDNDTNLVINPQAVGNVVFCLDKKEDMVCSYNGLTLKFTMLNFDRIVSRLTIPVYFSGTFEQLQSKNFDSLIHERVKTWINHIRSQNDDTFGQIVKVDNRMDFKNVSDFFASLKE